MVNSKGTRIGLILNSVNGRSMSILNNGRGQWLILGTTAQLLRIR